MYYHLTPSVNVSSILRDGLVPGCGRLSSIAFEEKHLIYLFTSYDEAINALNNWYGNYMDELDMFPITLLGVSYSNVIDEGTGYEVVVDHIIPSNCICIIEKFD